MFARWFPALTAVCVLAAAAPVRAADDKSEPILVVKVRSLNALIDTGKYLAGLAGQEEHARQVERMIKNRIGEKGLEGIDAKRPLGIYSNDLNPQRASPVFMVPVADQKALLKLLKQVDLEPTEKDGLYTVSPEFLPVEVYFRFGNGYAYITALNAGSVDKDRLLDPDGLKLPHARALAAATLNIDRIPRSLKQIAISTLEKNFQRIQKQKRRRKSEAEANLRVEALKEIAGCLTSVIKEGGQAGLQVEVNQPTHDLSLQMSLTGKSGSKLAQQIAHLGETTSLFSSLATADAAFLGQARFTLPEGIRKALGPMIDDIGTKIQEKERDETKRELGLKLFKALTPSLKAGELDYFLGLRGPNRNKHYTGVMAIKVQDGAELEKTIRDIIDRVAPQTEKDRIKFDADKVGDVAIHRITIKDHLDAGAKKTFGTPDLYVAFRKDAAIAVLGEEGLDVIKEAIASKSGAIPLVRYEISLARLVPLIAAQPHGEKAAAAADKIFKDAPDGGKIRFTVQGGKALRARVDVTALAVKFFVLTRKGAAEEEQE
jgi:hypothetical protein